MSPHLVQPLPRHAQQLQCRAVGRRALLKLRVLRLPVLPRRGHRLVQPLDALLETGHGVRQLLDQVRLLDYAGAQGLDLAAKQGSRCRAQGHLLDI